MKVNRRFGGRTELAIGFALVSCLTYSSTLKMEVTCFSETYADSMRYMKSHLRIPFTKGMSNICAASKTEEM
jgi:hypothetical protein